MSRDTVQEKPRFGHTVVGTSAKKLCDIEKSFKGVLIRADGGNSATVYVGGPSVTANSSATGGFPLVAGAAIQIPFDDPSELYVISVNESQDVAWVVQ